MKKHLFLNFPILIFLFSSTVLAQDKALQATVVSVSGNVKLQTEKGRDRVDIAVGTLIPVNGELFSGKNGEASIGISSGLVLTLKMTVRSNCWKPKKRFGLRDRFRAVP
ncbi:MAG: hypothetical protein HC904_12450 [Blastochloris sp.]|nr:hypothetical protein [Blastochloris sp.]